MKRKILLLTLALMMFMGVVSASSINGDYKGNPIVKVMSNGKQLQSDEVPAMIYDGNTVVPISLLRQLGASVEWNADTYSVDVKLSSGVVNKDNYNELKSYIDVMRFVVFINEQALLTSQIIALATLPGDLNSEQKTKIRSLIDQINTNKNNELTRLILGYSNISNQDKGTVESISLNLSNIHRAFYDADYTVALNKWTEMKNSIVNLNSKYESKLTEITSNLAEHLESKEVQSPNTQVTPVTNNNNMDEIKFYNKVVERYKSLVTIGKLMDDFYQAATVTHNSINSFDSSKLKDREAQLLNIISTYNYELNSAKEINVEGRTYNIDLTDLNGILNVYYSGIEDYKDAMALLNKFNVQRSVSDSANFITKLDHGLAIGKTALGIANPKYLEWQKKASNNK